MKVHWNCLPWDYFFFSTRCLFHSDATWEVYHYPVDMYMANVWKVFILSFLQFRRLCFSPNWLRWLNRTTFSPCIVRLLPESFSRDFFKNHWFVLRRRFSVNYKVNLWESRWNFIHPPYPYSLPNIIFISSIFLCNSLLWGSLGVVLDDHYSIIFSLNTPIVTYFKKEHFDFVTTIRFMRMGIARNFGILQALPNIQNSLVPRECKC